MKSPTGQRLIRVKLILTFMVFITSLSFETGKKSTTIRAHGDFGLFGSIS